MEKNDAFRTEKNAVPNPVNYLTDIENCKFTFDEAAYTVLFICLYALGAGVAGGCCSRCWSVYPHSQGPKTKIKAAA